MLALLRVDGSRRSSIARVEFEDVWVRTGPDGAGMSLAERAGTALEERLRAVVLRQCDGEQALAIWWAAPTPSRCCDTTEESAMGGRSPAV